MRIIATLAVLAALIGGAAALSRADADCRTTCNTFAGQQVCNTHCW